MNTLLRCFRGIFNSSDFYIFLFGLLIVVSFIVFVHWYFFRHYNGFQCWILETVIWFALTKTIISIEKYD